MMSLLVDNLFHDNEREEHTNGTKHKEEGQNRMQLDTSDRMIIMTELMKHTHPLMTAHDSPLINIVNGRVAPKEVNVDNALEIGQSMAARFTKGIPLRFYAPIKKQVISMEVVKKKVKIGNVDIYDMEKLYARLLVISQKRNIDLAGVFEYELSPVPSSLFDEYGDMRKGTKSTIIQKYAVFSESLSEPVDLELIDGNESLYHCQWPKKATMKVFVKNFVTMFNRPYEVIVVFDQYDEYSIKSHERQRRAKGQSHRNYVLTDNTILPPKEWIMNSNENKTSLIRYICATDSLPSGLTLVGEDSIFEHEEADVKLISYLLHASPHKKHIQVLADDTDIFVLLVYFTWYYNPTAKISMKKYNGQFICYVLLIQRSVRQKESTQDRNSRKRFNYLYSYSRSFLILI